MADFFRVEQSDRSHKIDLLQEGDGFVIGGRISMTAIVFCHGVIEDFISHYDGRFPIDWARIIQQVGESLAQTFFNAQTFNAIKAGYVEQEGNEQQVELKAFFCLDKNHDFHIFGYEY